MAEEDRVRFGRSSDMQDKLVYIFRWNEENPAHNVAVRER